MAFVFFIVHFYFYFQYCFKINQLYMQFIDSQNFLPQSIN